MKASRSRLVAGEERKSRSGSGEKEGRSREFHLTESVEPSSTEGGSMYTISSTNSSTTNNQTNGTYACNPSIPIESFEMNFFTAFPRSSLD